MESGVVQNGHPKEKKTNTFYKLIFHSIFQWFSVFRIIIIAVNKKKIKKIITLFILYYLYSFIWIM